MRILIISLSYYPEIGGNAMILTRIAQDIAAAGNEVHVVTGFPYHGLSEVLPEYRGKFFMREQHEGVHLHRAYNYTSPSKSIPSKILNQFSFVFSSILAALFTPRADVLLVPSPPLLLGMSGVVVSRLKRIPLVYNVQDIHPQALIDVGFMKNRSAIRFWEWVERFVYRKSDTVLAICEAARKHLIEEKNVPPEKTEVIENFTDTSHVRVLPRDNRFRSSHGLDEKYVVLFAGAMSMTQDLFSILEAADMLRDRGDIHFLIVGDGTQKQAVVRRAEEMELSNVTLLPFQPEEDLPYMMAAADLCLVTTKKTITMVSLPSKIWGIMAAARPIVATVPPDSAAAEVINKAEAGICTEAENAGKMKDSIEYMYEHPEEAAKMGRSGRDYVDRNNSRRVISAKYLDFFAKFNKKF